MFADCAASTDIRAFEKALTPILPHSKRRIHSIAFTPAAEGLRIEVRTDSCTGSSVLPSKGEWSRRVVTAGPTLARLYGKLGQGELKITYANDRLFLNALSVPATEEPAPASAQAGRVPRRVYCGGARIGALPTGDPAVDGMRMDLEEAIRERKRMRGVN